MIINVVHAKNVGWEATSIINFCAGIVQPFVSPAHPSTIVFSAKLVESSLKANVFSARKGVINVLFLQSLNLIVHNVWLVFICLREFVLLVSLAVTNVKIH